MSAQERRAVCDPDAFYPFRSLVDGGLSDPQELPAIERFLRAVVLHDELAIDLEPHPADPYSEEREWTEEEIEAGGRLVIVAYGPVVEKYGLFTEDYRKEEHPNVKLSPELIEIARNFSNAAEGDVFYKAHIEYIQRLLYVVARGGSVLCEGRFGRTAIEKATEFPKVLFGGLDGHWQEYARRIQAGRFGLVIPPVLAMVLNRCARREAIPAVVRDLRDEWSGARNKVWALVEESKRVCTLKEANDIEREFLDASKLFSPEQLKDGVSPLRMFWDLTQALAEGAAVAAVSGASFKVGAVAKLLSHLFGMAKGKTGEVRSIFRCGAFDLARRVSEEAAKVAPVPDLLSRFLSESEKAALGY